MERTNALQKVGRLAGALVAGAGLAFSLACGSFGTEVACSTSNVQVGVSPTQHTYAYDFACGNGHKGTVNGSYDTNSKVTQEKISNPDGTLIAEWNCPSDPWLTDGVRCQRLSVKANYKNVPQYPEDLATGTYGTFKLGPGRTYLQGRVDALTPPASGNNGGAHASIASFESSNLPGYFIRHRNTLGYITTLSSELDRADATWSVRPALNGRAGAVSFESVNYPGTFLRHQSFRLKQHYNDGTPLFRDDASFLVRPGLAGGNTTSFEAVNVPGHFIRHANYELSIAPNDGSELFRKDASYRRKDASYRQGPGPAPTPSGGDNKIATKPVGGQAPDLAAWPSIREGATGETAKTVQYLLRQHGATLDADGDYGPVTAQAVRAFQRQKGLDADGVVGPQTWEALMVPLYPDNQGEAVRAVQSQLASRGVAIAVTGSYGAETVAAVKAYQQPRTLAAHGMVTRNTWQALVNNR